MIPLIPIALGGAAILAGRHGSQRFSDSRNMDSQAHDLQTMALVTISDAKRSLEQTHDKLTAILQTNGEARLKALTVLRQIAQKIQRAGLSLPAELQQEMRDVLDRPVPTDTLAGTVASLGIGAGGGLATSAALYGGVGVFGHASTGTAIGSLTGAAKESAILAWLGGGSLAADGFGMAGGTFVLFGITFGVGMAIGGELGAFLSQDRLIDAQRLSRQAHELAGELDVVNRGLRSIGNGAKRCTALLGQLVDQAQTLLSNPAKTTSDLGQLVLALRYMQQLVDAPLLNANNEVNLSIIPLFDTVDKFISSCKQA